MAVGGGEMARLPDGYHCCEALGREHSSALVVRSLMALPASIWQFVLMTVFSLLAAHLVAAAVLSWTISTRRQRSPVRQWAQRRLMQRLARLDQGTRA